MQKPVKLKRHNCYEPISVFEYVASKNSFTVDYGDFWHWLVGDGIDNGCEVFVEEDLLDEYSFREPELKLVLKAMFQEFGPEISFWCEW